MIREEDTVIGCEMVVVLPVCCSGSKSQISSLAKAL